MNDEKHDGKQSQLEKHSLPGTNQAGEGPGECDEKGGEARPVNGQDTPPDPREKRSGTR